MEKRGSTGIKPRRVEDRTPRQWRGAHGGGHMEGWRGKKRKRPWQVGGTHPEGGSSVGIALKLQCRTTQVLYGPHGMELPFRSRTAPPIASGSVYPHSDFGRREAKGKQHGNPANGQTVESGWALTSTATPPADARDLATLPGLSRRTNVGERGGVRQYATSS